MRAFPLPTDANRVAERQLQVTEVGCQRILPPSRATGVEWLISDEPVPYEAAVQTMEKRAEAVAARTAPELIWLLQHPPIYTAGTSAKQSELIDARFPVHATGRGGQYTYHGPGQRVVYLVLDLRDRGQDVRCFVSALEEWIIRTLAHFGIRGERRDGRVGVWVARPDKGPGYEDKIAAIGVRVRRWVTFHGLSLNVDPDLSGYSGIVACGISEPHCGVTSLRDLGCAAAMARVDQVLRQEFYALFGAIAGHASSE